MDEIWLPVKRDYRYFISSFGRVKSIARRKERMLVMYVGSRGYRVVSLGRFDCTSVHRLVAEAFVSRKTEARYHVNHIDGNKQNNHFSNLEWVTPAENNLHARETGLLNINGSRNGFSKINEEIALRIVSLLKDGFNAQEISRKINVSAKIIYDIKCGKQWVWLTKISRGDFKLSKVITKEDAIEIIRLRKAGVYQRVIGEYLGIDQGSISRFEAGKTYLSLIRG